MSRGRNYVFCIHGIPTTKEVVIQLIKLYYPDRHEKIITKILDNKFYNLVRIEEYEIFSSDDEFILCLNRTGYGTGHGLKKSGLIESKVPTDVEYDRFTSFCYKINNKFSNLLNVEKYGLYMIYVEEGD